MEYKVNDKTTIDCKLSNMKKSINECKNCPAKKNCKFIEQSIKNDIEVLNKIEFRKFLYSQDCPNCKVCLIDKPNKKIEDCPMLDKNSSCYKKIEEKFYNSNNCYKINDEQLQKILKEIKDI